MLLGVTIFWPEPNTCVSRYVRVFCVQACAGTEGWSKDADEAWGAVMSFAILVVVERTVESWGSCHGMSLSEVRTFDLRKLGIHGSSQYSSPPLLQTCIQYIGLDKNC